MDNYAFIRAVGKGSYGEVNLVKHKTDRKQYVIKKLNLITSSKRERRSAEQEAQLLSRLRHPNIVTYRESWEGEDCQLYIVMGFCEGGDLYHRLKQQKGELLPERQVVEWFVQIAMALQYLHERNILHRDLKTQNIFLTKTNIIKVGDLGIARVLENQNDMASTLIGTPYYMSPELLSNKPYNHKSDVWALGCCVYEMSTLKHAFNARDMNSLVYRIVEGKLPQMPSRYDTQLGELIKSMLSKRPEDRPDVKLILRQPYIKRQIAMFLDATKEKTGRSRKKSVSSSGDCRANGSTSVSCQKKPERIPLHGIQARVKQGEENLLRHKEPNRVSDSTPVQTPLPPQASSPDAPRVDTASLASVSNINIDVQLQRDEEVIKRQAEESQSVASGPQAVNESRIKDGWKPDPSPSRSPAGLPPKSVEDSKERRESNGSLHIHQPGTESPRETFSVCGDNQRTDVDDTLRLLKEADVHNVKLGIKNEIKVFSVFEKKPQYKSREENAKVFRDIENNNDTVTLLKGAVLQHQSSDLQVSLESTEKLLEPLPATVEESPSPASEPAVSTPPLSSQSLVSQQPRVGETRRAHSTQEKLKVSASRPLPPPPIASSVLEHGKRGRRSTQNKEAAAITSGSAAKEAYSVRPLDRPLSARERRRLRQSQESVSGTALCVAPRSSYEIHASAQGDQCSDPVCRSLSDVVPQTCKEQDVLREGRSDEDECSSSTSSSERLEGDCRERKTDSCDMQDLVQVMTHTLRMDIGDAACEVERSRLGSSALPEFKLNRRYRDTLVLHGKACHDSEDLSLGEIPKGSTSGPSKIRRIIENLRTDVLKGLGVKLLDRVLEIMEEEDDNNRLELCLRNQMGDDKYQAYAVMVRQLKFLEDVALKI